MRIDIHDNLQKNLFCIPAKHKTNFDSVGINYNFFIIKKYKYK